MSRLRTAHTLRIIYLPLFFFFCPTYFYYRVMGNEALITMPLPLFSAPFPYSSRPFLHYRWNVWNRLVSALTENGYKIKTSSFLNNIKPFSPEMPSCRYLFMYKWRFSVTLPSNDLEARRWLFAEVGLCVTRYKQRKFSWQHVFSERFFSGNSGFSLSKTFLPCQAKRDFMIGICRRWTLDSWPLKFKAKFQATASC